MASVNAQKKLRGTASQNAAVTLEAGTIVYLTDTKQIAVHDGSTAGGTVFDMLPDQVSSGEKTAGTETAVRGFSPDDVKDMAETHSTSAFISYAILADVKTQNTAGGTFTSGSKHDRDLNTEIADPDNIVTVSSPNFTISGAGSYLIKWSAPAYDVNQHQSFLYDVTGTAIVRQGSSEYAADGGNVQTRSCGMARVTITSSNIYKIQHECTTGQSSDGFGRAANKAQEEYTQVEIYKEK
ncbi:hypothetical protein [Prosthecochloris sp.]|uniref:hypothetical protein n=1 Tax=Prosthecochloris sp. TaxID=290513 RepID=UPI0025D95F87|nr:hypothetical protein [Prosthecochloris sp.]